MAVLDVNEGSFVLEGVPELRFVDVLRVDASREARAAQLSGISAVHLRHFSDRSHVIKEWEAELAMRTQPSLICRHAWLVLHDDVPVGEFVMDSNIVRETVLIHYVALDKTVRRALRSDWLAKALTSLIMIMETEALESGATLAVAIAESDVEHSWHWEKMEWTRLDVNYREPDFGMHWSDFGSPSFFSRTPYVRFLNLGSDEVKRSVAVQALKAFLLDHYALNEDEPTVLETLTLAQSITL